ncbi:3-keto-steroid reductase/17-beta-hydroxysteroid dehydrogenase 7 isoform X3 [Sylvia atricapilla]|uniref:3-keto-steroid reductase/17-beta-hydroxysteroid dehydrogenase 7 isoform X3 n=1 Tax=Sylvia atricapilla TaxID=48155 RepID=UPI0033907D90
MERVVLVTGASGGVGLALCQRLLEEDGRIHLCIACRNEQKSEATRDLLLTTYPAAQVSTVEVDLGNLASVLRAARELRCRFQRLDFVYLNAGIMPNPHVNFKALWHGLLTGFVNFSLCSAVMRSPHDSSGPPPAMPGSLPSASLIISMPGGRNHTVPPNMLLT